MAWVSTLQRYTKMACVGGLSLVLQLVIFNLLRLIISPITANITAAECAILNNFVLNNYFAFGDRQIAFKQNIPHWFGKFLQFNFLSLGSLMLQAITLHLGMRLIADGWYWQNAWVMLGIFLGSLLNYIIYSRYVWQSTKCN